MMIATINQFCKAHYQWLTILLYTKMAEERVGGTRSPTKSLH